MKHKGKLIIFEGLDGAGKGTQLHLLQEYLEQENQKDETQIIMFQEYLNNIYNKNQQFELFSEYLISKKKAFATYDFPRYYDNFWGGMVGRMLSGEFKEDIDPYLRSMFYLLDQADACKKIRKDLHQGKIVICNRYITSSYIFQTGMFKSAKDKAKYITWLEEAGYQQLGIIKPDVVLCLYVKPEIAQELILKKNARDYLQKSNKDINEKNLQIQINAGREMLRFCKERKNWHLIDCMQEDQLKSQEEIAREIRSYLAEYINL
jgi:dTMP kinase